MKNKQAQRHAPYKEVKHALAGKGITYRDVAELLGITETTVQQKLNGTSDFYISEQVKICEKFSIEPALFFAGDVA